MSVVLPEVLIRLLMDFYSVDFAQVYRLHTLLRVMVIASVMHTRSVPGIYLGSNTQAEKLMFSGVEENKQDSEESEDAFEGDIKFFIRMYTRNAKRGGARELVIVRAD